MQPPADSKQQSQSDTREAVELDAGSGNGPSELPEKELLPAQFSLIGILGLVTLCCVYIAFMNAHGLKSIPIGVVGLCFLITAFAKSPHGLHMIVACALATGCCGAATIPLLMVPTTVGWFVGTALWGFVFGLLAGGLMSCFAEVGAHVLILGRLTTPGNHQAILADYKLTGKRRFCAWLLAILWLGIWNWGWLH